MHFKKQFLVIALAVTPASLWAQAPVVDINSQSRQGASNANVQGELYQQLQQLRQEIMELRGSVEEQGHQIRQLKQQSLDRYIDLDRRIGASSGGAPAMESADAMLDGSANGDADGVGEPTNTVSGQGQGNMTAGAGAQAEIGSASPSTPTGDESSDYSKAYDLVRDRQFEQAITAFNAYVQRYPDGRYTPNAWYWLGELHIAVKPQNLPAATTAFQKLLADYPDNGKVPAAMYKLATVYFLADQKQKSKEMLTHVIDRYSNTGNSAVQKSREFLRKNF